MFMPGNRNHVLEETSEAVAFCSIFQMSDQIVEKVFQEQKSSFQLTRNQQKKQNMMIGLVPKSWDLESSLAPKIAAGSMFLCLSPS
jgi:hypothetical protein